MFALKMYLSFIYTIYHLSKAANHFLFVKVAATLVITPQGARKTIARQTAEKVLETTAASQLNYLPLYLLMYNRVGQHFLNWRCTHITNTRCT